MDTILWADKSSEQMEQILKKNKTAIVPIGSTEQHGPHLPTGTDHIVGWEIAKRVGERTGALVLPVIPVGFSEDHFPRAGTISLSADTLRNVITDIASSLSRNGIKNVVVLSGHAGHLMQLSAICYELNVSGNLGDTKVHNFSPYNVLPMEALSKIMDSDVVMHAEELETSLILFLRPELVDMKKAVKNIPSFMPRGLNPAAYMEGIRVLTTSKFLGRDVEYGVCGDATVASREKGEKILEILVDAITDAVKNATET